MFRFLCPMCQHSMEVPERHAGTKTRCKRCGQKLLIPMPPQPMFGSKKKGAKKAGLGGLLAYSRYFVAAGILGVFAFGGYYLYSALTEGSVGLTVEVRRSPRNAAERAVRDMLVRNVRRPDQVKFEKWGPHLYRREFDSLMRLADAQSKETAAKLVKTKNFDCIVRVAYQMGEVVAGAPTGGALASGGHDHLFVVKGIYVSQLEDLPASDDWKEKFQHQILHSGAGGDDKSKSK